MVCERIFWSENEKCPFSEDSTGIQNLEQFGQKWPSYGYFNFFNVPEIGNSEFFTAMGQERPMIEITKHCNGNFKGKF